MTKATPFATALSFSLRWEGGWSNHILDPGGATMCGVTQRTYDSWREARGLPIRTVEEIEAGEIRAIYYTRYWLAAACDKQPLPLSTAMFDFAVNSGPTRAIKSLQRILCVNDDGIWGPKTQAALDAIEDVNGLCEDLNDLREEFYMKIIAAKPRMGVFLKGWMNRLNALRKECSR